MTVHRNSRTPHILELYDAGVRHQDIARVVDCSVANVSKTISRFRHRQYRQGVGYCRISPLPEEHMAWLREEAKKTGTPTLDIARALLVDAIEEARNGKR